MHPGTLRALEFDRIVAVVTGLAVTPTGRNRLAQLHPSTVAAEVIAAQRATTEGDTVPRRSSRLSAARAVGPRRRFSRRSASRDAASSRCACWGSPAISSQSSSRGRRSSTSAPPFRCCARWWTTVASFKHEIADVRRKIEPSGEVADNASPALASIRERLRKQKQRLRTTLDGFLRGRDAEVSAGAGRHRSQRPPRADGARRASRVDSGHRPWRIGQRREPVRRAARDRRDQQRDRRARGAGGRGSPAHSARADRRVPRRPDELERTIEVATELDVIQARARFSIMVGGVRAGRSPQTARSICWPRVIHC